MFASLRGTRLYFDIDGAGLVADGGTMRERPVAMLVHGGPGGDHSGFKPSMSPLAERMQLVYFDHRGQGRSDPADPASYTLDENVEDMEALRRHLGLGPIVSIGTSYGGMVAMAHAARYPDAVSHLLLIVTAAHGGFIPRAQQILQERGSEMQRRACETLWAGGFRTADELRQYYDVMGPLYARKHDPAAAAGRLRATYAPEPLNRAFGPRGFLRLFDLRPELGRIKAPTLLLAGRHDWICPPEFSEEIQQLVPGSDLRIFEESSHSIRVDEPQAMLDAIVGFVVYRR
ncbi:MAG TPA: alpha/beta fold hydrolase [Acetobacteraceae bacterium]|jgi:proline iminopeptidase|nr:alpha/beta fold hydrolase [Acetobacteraceae bacterium]